MRHDDTRDNCTNLEATLIAADAYEDTREDVGGATWHECQCEACTSDEYNDGANGYDPHGWFDWKHGN